MVTGRDGGDDWQSREGRGPAASVAVERREAPAPYVTGGMRRRSGAGGPRHGPQGASADALGASRRSISLVREGEEKGERASPAPEIMRPRAA